MMWSVIMMAGGAAANGFAALETKVLSDEKVKMSVPIRSEPEKLAVPTEGRKLQGCNEPFFEIGPGLSSRYGTHVGAYNNPFNITPGCPTAVSIAPGQNFYMQISGFMTQDQHGSYPQLLYEWDVDTSQDETPISMFSFRFRPTFGEVDEGNFWDWYWWPLLHADGTTFRENLVDFIDYYHCYGYCQYESSGLTNSCQGCGSTDFRTIYDTIMISVISYNAAETMGVTYIADLVYNNRYILPAELQAIKDMFSMMCWPWAAPADFDWDTYQIVESAARGEGDTRRKPYCDWWQGITLAEVMAFDTLSCLDMPGIVCDDQGHVSDLILDTVGIRGPLPPSFSSMTHLKYLELQNNRINGTLPTHVFDSDEMVKMTFYNNMMTGTLPCPTNTAENIVSINVARNDISGPIPSCLFTHMPELSVLSMGRNALHSPVPIEIQDSPKISALYLDRTGLTGTLTQIHNLSRIASLDLSHNFLDGPLTYEFIAGMPKLYLIDLSWNDLNGTMPVIDSNDGLRRIDFSHNEFEGTLTDQFTVFAANQKRGLLSSLDISTNSFCGPLPEIFYDLIMDSHYFVYSLDVSDNHFTCSKDGDNLFFDDWAFNMNYDFGQCVPIPEISGVMETTVSQGDEIMVIGKFVQTTGGTCKFTYNGGAEDIVPAIFYSTSKAGCMLPSDAPIGGAIVTVAHYCMDYASAETLTGYTPTQVAIVEPATVSSSSKKSTKTDTGVVIWAVIGSVLAVLLCCLVGFVFMREKKGNPLFKPLAAVENPVLVSAPHDVKEKEGENIDLQVSNA